QLPSAYTAVALSSGPPTDRNFTEHYDSPILFPLKSILAEAVELGILQRNAPVLANQPDAAVKPVPGIPVSFAPLGELRCECSSDQPNVLALFIRYANLNAAYRDRAPQAGEIYAPRPERDVLWRTQREARPACLVRLRQSCKHVLERKEGGEVVAA